ncbi:MAG: hypothetical protein WA108_14695 [Thiobacillus sp.]
MRSVRQDGSVLVLGKHDVLEARALKTGLANWAFTEVLAGLAVGDRVGVSSDDEGIAAGVRVTPKTAQP